MAPIDMSLYVRRCGTLKTEFAAGRTLEAFRTMFDGLLEVGFDRAHGDTEQCRDLAVGHAFDAREREHAATTLRKLRDRALQEIDLGAILDHPRGIRRLIRNLEQAVHLVGGQTALLRATPIARDVER